MFQPRLGQSLLRKVQVLFIVMNSIRMLHFALQVICSLPFTMIDS